MNDDWLYSDIVKDHFFNPRNYLATDEYKADGFGTAGSPVCGDLMKVWIKVDPKTNKIIDCKWQTFGCASAIASTSMMSVMVLENGGMSPEEAKKITTEGIMKRLGGLPDNKIHCSVLGHLALREAINDYIKKNKEEYFYLKNKKEEAPGVLTLDFSSKNGVFDFKPGQFAIFKILKENKCRGLSRAYTITSLPGQDYLSITVKRAGVFSNALCDLEAGDKVDIAGPYGDFYPQETSKNLVFMAGGIGVTPFYAILKDMHKNKIGNSLTLFYSNRTEKDIIFFKELKEISGKLKNLKLVNILTRDNGRNNFAAKHKRMDIEMIKKYCKDLKENEYFICGPSGFVLSMKEQLKTAGIDPNYIKIEAFY